MRHLRSRSVKLVALSFVLAAGAVVGIAAAYGFGAFAAAWTHLQPAWLTLAVAAGLLAMPAYGVAYRAVAGIRNGPSLPAALVIRLVAAGFGPFSPQGGFALDKRALHALDGDEQSAVVRVLGLGALEWASLAPVAWICAIVLLTGSSSGPIESALWPWAIAVPIGFVGALTLATEERRSRLWEGRGRWRAALARSLDAIAALRTLAIRFRSNWLAWAGVALYWTLDIASFYAALRFVSLRIDLTQAIIAYATGYALTRRSMPLGGAGVTEALMTFSLHWVGASVAPALAAVVVYRALNFVAPTVPALLVRPRVLPLLQAADEGRTPTPEELSAAAAPLGSGGAPLRSAPAHPVR